ncbi:hypothetical protein V9T40_012396 [Parthenolecanium corni]|uniref:Uncharacterized protein n=1 Tax=Parthenolecanium corni TaxID=536013 RepID=A0AAN9T7Q7_9HEMI
MDESFLPIAVLFLLLTGTHEQDVLNELTESQIGSPEQSKDVPRKKVKSQTYVRATTLEEFIEVERTDEDGLKSYKVEAKLEPFEVLLPVKEVIKDKTNDLKLTLELKQLKVDGINKFKIQGSSNKNKNKDGADISFDLPSAIKLTSPYTLHGTMATKKVQGNGNIDLSIVGVSVNGLVQIADDGQELRIQNLELSYDFKNIQLKFTGLKIDGLDDKETEELTKELTKKYLKDNSETISERLAQDIRIKLNRKLKGVSSTKIISMLKSV